MADYKKYQWETYDPDDESGEGGQTGAIEFRDFLESGASKRDDALPIGLQKQILNEHQYTHEGRVKNQKALNDKRQDLKERKKAGHDLGHGAAYEQSDFKPHPLLNTAQFSGDNKTIPTVENTAESNKEEKNEFVLKNVPQLAPKLSPTHNLTPTLRRG